MSSGHKDQALLDRTLRETGGDREIAAQRFRRQIEDAEAGKLTIDAWQIGAYVARRRRLLERLERSLK